MEFADTGSELEFRSLLRQPIEVRYAHFIKRAADQEQVWSLWRGEWLLAVGDDGMELHPVWPAAMCAAACATGEWAGAEPRSIPLRDWLDIWTPGMIADDREVVVFPIPEGAGGRVDPLSVATDLRDELGLME